VFVLRVIDQIAIFQWIERELVILERNIDTTPMKGWHPECPLQTNWWVSECMDETECLNVWMKLSVCNCILVYACMYKIKEWNVFFIFNSTMATSKDCCPLPLWTLVGCQLNPVVNWRKYKYLFRVEASNSLGKNYDKFYHNKPYQLSSIQFATTVHVLCCNVHTFALLYYFSCNSSCMCCNCSLMCVLFTMHTIVRTIIQLFYLLFPTFVVVHSIYFSLARRPPSLGHVH
jgi:hypothetical protein